VVLPAWDLEAASVVEVDAAAEGGAGKWLRFETEDGGAQNEIQICE
jgi:hypothetical protein